MVLVIGRSTVADVLAIDEVLTAVESAHAALAIGTAIQPLRANLELPASNVLLVPMVAASAPHRIAGLKLLTDAPDNPARGLARQQSVIVAVDPATGTPEAILDGALITRLRTAAASAVATKYLANPDASTLGLVGAGRLAAAHVAAIRRVRPINRVMVWSRSSATVRQFADELSAGPDGDIRIEWADTPREAVEAADVLCTLTPSRTPIVEGAWLHPGMHLNVVGAPPRPDYREIDSAVVLASRLVVDSVAVALAESGALRVPLAEGLIDPVDVRVEIGDVVIGATSGRRESGDITLYNSVGVAVQDLATARAVIDAVRRHDLATDIDLTA